MHSSLRLSFVAACLSVVVFSGVRARAQAERFVPEKHFPKQSIAFLSVGSVGEFRDKLTKTLLGRMVTHPGVHRAFAGLFGALGPQIEQVTDTVVTITGKQPGELLEMLSGELAISFSGIGPNGPEIIVAIELGEHRDAILALVERLGGAFEGATNQKLRARKVGKFDFSVWPMPGAQLHVGPVGSHLLLMSSPNLADAVVQRFGAESAEGLGANPLYQRLQAKHKVADRQMFFMVDLAMVRRLVLSVVSLSQGADAVPQVLRLIGLDKLSSASLAVGHEDNGLDVSSYLESHGGTGGILDVLRRGLPPVESIDAALEKFPARTTDLYAARYRPGFIVKELVKLAKEVFPENAADIDGGIQMLNGMIGVPSFVEKFSELPDVTVYGAVIPPPAGSLISDRVWLVKTAEVEPGWKLLEEWGTALEARPRTLKSKAGTIRYLNLASGKLSQGLSIWRLAQDPERALGKVDDPRSLAMVFLVGSTVSRADIGDGWSVMANMPQALTRYLYYYKKGPRLSDNNEIASIARTRLKGASLAGVTDSGADFLWFYNTVVSGTSYFSGLLTMVGIDVGRLPTGESFRRYAKSGFFRIATDDDGFSFRVHRPLASGIGPLAGVALVAGVVTPAFAQSRGEARGVVCANNLKQIYVSALLQADKRGGAFPFSERGGHHGLQKIVDGSTGNLTPRIFVCPHGHETAANATPKGFKLSAGTCSYEMVSWRIKLSGGQSNAILIYDKQPHPNGRRYVVFADGSVRPMVEQEFQRQLRRERERYGQK